MTAAARKVNGATLKLDISGSDTAIGLLDTIKPPMNKVGTERITPLESGKSVPVATGESGYETSQFGVYLDLLDTTHSYLLKITHDRTHADYAAKKTFTLTLPVSGLDPWIFTGITESFEVTAEKNSLQKGQATIQVDDSTQLPLPTA